MRARWIACGRVGGRVRLVRRGLIWLSEEVSTESHIELLQMLERQRDEVVIHSLHDWGTGYRTAPGRANYTRFAAYNSAHILTVGGFLRRRLTAVSGIVYHLTHCLFLHDSAARCHRHDPKTHCRSLERSQHCFCDDSWNYGRGVCRRLCRSTCQSQSWRPRGRVPGLLH